MKGITLKNNPITTYLKIKTTDFDHVNVTDDKATFTSSKTDKTKVVKLKYQKGETVFIKEPYYLEALLDNQSPKAAYTTNNAIAFSRDNAPFIVGKVRAASTLTHEMARKKARVKHVSVRTDHDAPARNLNFWRIEYSFELL